jgi:hypothetical protein
MEIQKAAPNINMAIGLRVKIIFNCALMLHAAHFEYHKDEWIGHVYPTVVWPARPSVSPSPIMLRFIVKGDYKTRKNNLERGIRD